MESEGGREEGAGIGLKEIEGRVGYGEEGAEAMQMESYTAEKRILNQQLGRRRASPESMLTFHPWSNVGGRIPAEICIRACLRFCIEPCPPHSFRLYSLQSRSTKQHKWIWFTIDV